MTPDDVKEALGDLPYMTLAQGRQLTDFLHDKGLSKILELGFYHGVSSCYLAAAMQATKGSPIVTIDLPSAEDRSPNIETLLERCGLKDHAEFYYEPAGYSWRLMKLIEENTRRFDFCYIDGGHDWDRTGYGFFLVDKVLEPGGWIVFDDLKWTMENIDQPWATRRTLEERATPQVQKVWDLLVKPHPNYGEFIEQGNWAFAQKIAG